MALLTLDFGLLASNTGRSDFWCVKPPICGALLCWCWDIEAAPHDARGPATAQQPRTQRRMKSSSCLPAGQNWLSTLVCRFHIQSPFLSATNTFPQTCQSTLRKIISSERSRVFKLQMAFRYYPYLQFFFPQTQSSSFH